MTATPPPALGAPQPAPTASRRIAVNSALQAGALAFGQVGQLVLYAVMAREAGLLAFGDFTTAASLAIFVMVAAFGMDFRITRLVAREEPGAGEAFWCALVLKLMLGIVILACAVGVALAGPYSDTVTVTTLLLGATVLGDLAMLTPHAVFRGLERLRPVAMAIVLYRGVLAIAGTAVLLAGGPVEAVAAVWVGAVMIGLAYSFWKLHQAGINYPVRVSRGGMRAVALDSFGLGAAAVFGAVISRADIVILGLLTDSAAVALYGGALRLVESMQFLWAALALSAFPMLARLSATTTPTLGEAATVAVKVTLVVVAPIAVLYALYAEPILTAIYGPEFGEAGLILRLLAPTLVMAATTSVVTYLLTAQRRQKPILIALGVATVVNLVANVAIIPARGAEGAALAMMITMIVFSALFARATVRVTGRISPIRIAAGPVLAGAAMAAVGLGLGGSPLGVVPALAAFGLVLAGFERWCYPADAERVVKSLRGRPAL